MLIRLPLMTCGFTVRGLNLERFVNAAQKAGVPLLYVRRTDARTIVCECYLADMNKLSTMIAEKGWKLEDVRPLRLAAVLRALRQRPGLWIGALMTLIMMFTLTRFIWRVEIVNAGAYRADISAFLTEQNICPGIPRQSVDAGALENALMRRYPEIAWFHVYAYNVTLAVEVSPGVPLPKPQQSVPEDIVAARDGLIYEVRVFAGTARVKPGDIVRKGQLLIEGVERAADEQTTAVAARGEVVARCWRSHTVITPAREIITEETGRETSFTQLATPWFRWPAAIETPNYLACQTYSEVIPVVGCLFPVWRQRTTWREAALSYAERDTVKAREEAEEAALSRLKNALYGNELIDKWSDYCMIEGDRISVTVTVEWLSDIGEAR